MRWPTYERLTTGLRDNDVELEEGMEWAAARILGDRWEVGWGATGESRPIPTELATLTDARGEPMGEWTSERMPGTHGRWVRLYRPSRERIAREERWWKARGVWPPPKDRSEWPEEL